MLVIGGGITGAGCALDAASRGFRTALVERDDFASGTSSKSSKLVHGGIRYLQQTRDPARLREPPRAPAGAEERAAPRARAAVPHPDLLERRPDRSARRPRARWRDVDVRPDRGSADPEAPRAHLHGRSGRAHADAAARQGRERVHLLRLPNRRRAPDARHRPDRGRARRGRRERAARDRDRQGRRRQGCRGARRGRRHGARDPRPGRRERDRRVVRRAAHDGRGITPRVDPARQGHPHLGAVVQGPQRHRGDRARPEGQAVRLRRPVG